MTYVAGSFLAMAVALLSLTGPIIAADEQQVDVYADCVDVSCPLFQVAIRHREIVSESAHSTPAACPNLPVAPVGAAVTVAATAPGSRQPSAIKTPATPPKAQGLYVVSESIECSKTANVPHSVFKAVKAVMGSVEHSINQNGGAAPALTPLQQTMLLFYTTIMQQTLNFDCSFNGAASGRSTGDTQ